MAAAAFILALVACEKESLPQEPQLWVNREDIGFGLNYIGTKPQESLTIENHGLDDLTIESATLSGDGAFTLEGPLKTVLKGKERTFLRVIFTPTAAKDYSSTLTIKSNAQNTPEQTVPVTGKGVAQSADAGG
jgi:hypothetical protein